MKSDLFAGGFKNAPYWWDDVSTEPPGMSESLPAEADVVIVGSGYTGLSAALQTARGGRSTVVVDAEAAGWGCSTRNGGQVGTSIKPGYGELARLHGADKAFAMVKEGHNALAYIEQLIKGEQLDCDWEKVGRFFGAHNEAAFRALVGKLRDPVKGLEVEYEVVPKAEQHREIGSDFYCGGVVYPTHASLQPAKFQRALLDRVKAAGATIVPHCRVNQIERSGQRFSLRTSKGSIAARDVVVATNGYTGSATPYLQRRVIPIGSYMIATEPLDRSLTAKLIPKARVISNTRRLVFYYRLSPDRSRVLFGGRVALAETNPEITAPRLRNELAAVFPELRDVKVSHAWHGFIAYTFDTMPHLGKDRDGVHYAMGYCGSGVSLASYFGMRIGQQVLGTSEGRTALDGLSFPTRPLYYGKPWFLAGAIAWYRLRDRINL